MTDSRESLPPPLLEATLDAVPLAAFLVGPGGEVRFANKLGAALLATEGEATRRALSERIAGRESGVPISVHAVRYEREPEHWLAVMAVQGADAATRAAAAKTRWRLTPRETEVLLLLVRGTPSKLIARQLGCAEATVELHVGRLLAKAEADNRTALVARFWTER